MEKKRSVMFVMTCSECHKKWQTPGMWNESFSVPSLLHNDCPNCGNWKHNIGYDITNNPERAGE